MFRAVEPAKGEVKMMTWGQGDINPEQQLAGEPTHDLCKGSLHRPCDVTQGDFTTSMLDPLSLPRCWRPK